jgi:hypothetical protein
LKLKDFKIMTPFPPIDRTSASFKNDLDALFLSRLPNLINELNALQGNMNSIAAGGAYAIPYTFRIAGTPVGDPNGGRMTFDNSPVSSVATLLLENKDARGVSVGSILSSMTVNANSTIKGTIRVQSLDDPSRWAIFSVTGTFAVGGTYSAVSVQYISASSATPFNDLEDVVFYFQRSGDAGGSGMAQTMIVRDEKANGTLAQVLSAATWNRRHLTRVTANSIPGAQLNANLIILPAGNYVLEASSPAANCNGNQARLYNVTDNVLLDLGTSDCNYIGNYATTKPVISRSVLQTSFSITSTKSFAIDHWVEEIGSGGRNANAGVAEVYTTVKITKVS